MHILKKGKFVKLDEKYRRNELTKQILLGLAEGAFIVGAAAVAPNVLQVLKLFEPKGKDKIRRVLKGLRRRRMIEFVEKGDHQFIEITEDGYKQIKQYNFDDLSLKRRKRWDGKWHLAIFDVPERHGLARRALQEKFSQLGLYQYQKSIYAFPFDFREELEYISRFFEIERFVKYLIVEEIDDEIKLIDHFKLPSL